MFSADSSASGFEFSRIILRLVNKTNYNHFRVLVRPKNHKKFYWYARSTFEKKKPFSSN